MRQNNDQLKNFDSSNKQESLFISLNGLFNLFSDGKSHITCLNFNDFKSPSDYLTKEKIHYLTRREFEESLLPKQVLSLLGYQELEDPSVEQSLSRLRNGNYFGWKKKCSFLLNLLLNDDSVIQDFLRLSEAFLNSSCFLSNDKNDKDIKEVLSNKIYTFEEAVKLFSFDYSGRLNRFFHPISKSIGLSDSDQKPDDASLLSFFAIYAVIGDQVRINNQSFLQTGLVKKIIYQSAPQFPSTWYQAKKVAGDIEEFYSSADRLDSYASYLNVSLDELVSMDCQDILNLDTSNICQEKTNAYDDVKHLHGKFKIVQVYYKNYRIDDFKETPDLLFEITDRNIVYIIFESNIKIHGRKILLRMNAAKINLPLAHLKSYICSSDYYFHFYVIGAVSVEEKSYDVIPFYVWIDRNDYSSKNNSRKAAIEILMKRI